MTRISGSEYFRKSVDVNIDAGPHDCPVCGQTTFAEGGSYDICSVCNWEDDPLQTMEPDLSVGANDMSLNDAKKLWSEGKRIP